MSRTRRRYSRRHRPWYRKITRGHVGLLVVAAVLVVALIFAVQAVRASSALHLAANQAEVLQNQIVAGDDAGARSTLAGLRESTARARGLTDGPLWDLGARVPYFGRNVSAVRTVSEAIDQVATEALPPVVELSKQINLNTFSPKDGKIDLAAVAKIAPSVAVADKALTSAGTKVDGIDVDSLFVPLRGPVGAIQHKIGTAQAAAHSSALASRLLPSMLGGKDTRHYLLLIQNNAEVRSTGGISGSFAILKAKKGKLTMGEQGSIHDLLPFGEPVVKLTKDEKTVFSPALAKDLRDANLTPDFPRTAQITRAMVDKGLDQEVDGVISVDPVALSRLLAGIGPVKLPSGFVLDQDNVVSVLLNQVYQAFEDYKVQDEVFANAARTIFDIVRSGQADARLVIGGLVAAADENRLMVWSAHDDEQKLIAATGLSGALSGDDGATPHVGLYLSDASAGKMEYYLDYTTAVRADRCLDGGVQELSTTTQLTSSAPEDVKQLSSYITGDGTYTPRGTMRLVVRLYSPFGGGFTAVDLDGKRQTVYADRHLGRNVTKLVLTIKPGESHTITTTMISGRGQTGDGVFSTTPGVHPTRNDVPIASACG